MLDVKYKMLGKKGTIFVFLTFAICHLTFNIASAASLFFDPSAVTVREGQSFNLNLQLDPEGEDINAIELELAYSSNTLTFTSAPTGKSIVSLWIESPQVSGSSIRMAGIMPGGFSGFLSTEDKKLRPGTVISLVFKGISEGSGVVSVKNFKVIKNDGSGTLINAKTSQANISVLSGADPVPTGVQASYDYQDSDSPDLFVPSVIKSKHLYDGKFALIFHTNDATSGVEHYEVREGDGDYHRAESPYLLEDQSLAGIIYVRAIDFAGNARTVTLDPKTTVDGVTRDINLAWILVPIVALVIIALLISWLVKRRNPYN